MAGGDDGGVEAEGRADDPAETGQAGYDVEEQRRGAAHQERHRLEARRFFQAAPLFRIQFEENGTASLCKKHYDYWHNRPPELATRWRVISNHPDLEQAERRLRHVTSPHIYYDERGRLAPAPTASGRAWAAGAPFDAGRP